MSLYCAVGGVDTDLSFPQLNDLLCDSLAKLGARHACLPCRRHDPLLLPGRQTHAHGVEVLWRPAPGGDAAIGTHTPMPPEQLEHMFGDMPNRSSACTTGVPMWRLSARFRQSICASSLKASSTMPFRHRSTVYSPGWL